MLRLWLRRMSIKPGFCDKLFTILKRKAEGTSAGDRCCALLLDEISLKRGLTFDKSVDQIDGLKL